MPARHLVLPLGDAARNLATEEVLFRTLAPGHPGLFLLWRNEPAVIVGRHQCVADEVDLSAAGREGIPVIRRITGGGAVFHDAGTLCFSWIVNDAGMGSAFAPLLAQVARALADMGVPARLTGRNDLEAGGLKISGSAQFRSGGRLLVHGTLLVRTDLERMGRLLTPGAAKRRAHGVASVRGRVGNVADLWTPGSSMESLQAALLARCAPDAEPPDADLAPMAGLLAQRKYRSPDWNMDATTAATRTHAKRFPWGGVELRLTVRDGRLCHCRISGDFFSDDGVEALEQRLEGCPAEAGAVRRALDGVEWERIFLGCEAEAMRGFFISAVPGLA
ncbi:MAG: lipoate--protein ligase [Desulfovibrio sp.]|nr:lipoate--protein ligase [Desulfovibrio sp.]